MGTELKELKMSKAIATQGLLSMAPVRIVVSMDLIGFDTLPCYGFTRNSGRERGSRSACIAFRDFEQNNLLHRVFFFVEARDRIDRLVGCLKFLTGILLLFMFLLRIKVAIASVQFRVSSLERIGVVHKQAVRWKEPNLATYLYI